MAWTEAQQRAIETREKTVLVSAAAGSGKTTTLTERIIRLLTDKENPADISRFLIVTFTKAAAADLRSKISGALGEALAKDPSNRHLSRQMINIGSADICTIDSFYLNVVRKNFELLGLPAKLSMIDPGELQVLKLTLIEDVIEYFYDKKDPLFLSFMDGFLTSRGSGNASGELLKLYNDLSGYPEFLEYLPQNARRLRKEAEMPFFETRAGRELQGRLIRFLHHAVRVYEDALEILDAYPEIAAAYGPSFKYDYDYFVRTCSMAEKGDYSGVFEAFSGFGSVRLGSLRGDARALAKEPEIENIKVKRTEIRDVFVKDFAKKQFAFTEDQIRRDLLKSAEYIEIIYELLSEFDRRLSEEKLSRGVCDFIDNKRFTLKLFIDGDGEPTTLAKEYSEKYDAIYIDEYQDTDSVQDMIFSAISRPGNRFMVGDIKQSIYRFRGADPSVFASYKNTFPDVLEAEESNNCAIYMSDNFRCDEPVIRVTNGICGHLFRNGPNSIAYTGSDDLVCSKVRDDGREEKNVRLTVVRGYTPSQLAKMPDEERLECDGVPSELEIRAVINEIRRLVDDPKEQCGSKNGPRSIKYGDIAILTRDNKTANSFADALTKCGIPCSARTEVNYFENPEVLLVMSLLNVIDNPQKDVYLAGVLRSPLFGFGMSDLIEIRKKSDGAASLFDDLIYSSEHSENEELRAKIGYFLEKLNTYRVRSRLLPVDRLIKFIYSDTSVLSFASGGGDDTSDMNMRRANLLLLYDYARRYETGSYKGLYSFISYVNDIIESGQTVEPPKVSGSSDIVSVMTIHNSKGLEFPVCFIAATRKGGKGNDGNIRFDHDLGLGLEFGDESGFSRCATALRNAVIGKNKREEQEEQMRVLYVAMTRARERLYISASVTSDDWEEKAEQNARYSDEYTIMSCPSHFDWIMNAYYAMDDETRSLIDFIKLQPRDVSPLPLPSDEMRGDDVRELDTELTERLYRELSERFKFQYDYSHLSRIPAKLSVSRLYPEVLDEEDAETPFEGEITLRDKPSFLIPISERASGADRGTATHTFMQFCDFDKAEKSVKNEVARLCELGLLAKEMGELINVHHVERFFESDFYLSMKKAVEGGGRLYREQRFNIALPAVSFSAKEELREKIKDEKIVVQGVIDLVFIDKNGEITLCDYKTDYLNDVEKRDATLASRKLSERHGGQLSYYSTAVERIFGRAPSRICIYSLPFGEALDITIANRIE